MATASLDREPTSPTAGSTTARARGGRRASWYFRGHVFCTFYDPPLPPPLNGGCWTAIKTSANCYEFYLAGLNPSRPSTTKPHRDGPALECARLAQGRALDVREKPSV